MAGALETSEGILLDGANSVSGQSRAGFPNGLLFSGLALAAFCAALVLLRRGRPKVVSLVLLAAAIPGAVFVLALRADALHRRGELAASVSRAVAEVQREAPWPSTAVQMTHEDDDVVFPIGRYALPSRPEVSPSVRLELRGGSLSFACRRAEDRVICGAPP